MPAKSYSKGIRRKTAGAGHHDYFVVTVRVEHTLADCMRIMTDHRVRHLPVLDGEILVGVISIGDIVRAIISAQADTIRQLSSYITGDYPA